ncbi:adhesin [uncultured Methanobrevibacter sp.]|uniref:adhesin n=1 Tax=uncultured Methanobrevibacter sp. TaxID=253161 RepID=UPI0026188405|nr:adhesin [uncultured Methanobrevibacter sp.]
MKKQIVIILLAILLLTSIIQEVSATTTVFLTSDNIMGTNEDADMLNSIKTYIEDMSNGKIKVIVDSQAPGPGEGTRAIEANANVSVALAAVDPGNFLVLSKYSSSTPNKQIIFVNTGDYDLDNANSLRRAWDDNYSKSIFAGINQPGTFLNDSGVNYIQPLKEYPDKGSDGHLSQNNDEANKYIAQEIINKINNYNSTKHYNNDLVITHKLAPSSMAQASQSLLNNRNNEMNDTYNNYSAEQLLYLTSSYLNGNGLESPKDYKAPNSPLKYSILTKDSYSIYDYIKMGGIVKNYMDEHEQAPDYICYDGAYISYYDLQYNFAKITANHTDASQMDFNREYHFDKVNDTILLSILPVVLVILVIMFIYVVFKRLLRK